MTTLDALQRRVERLERRLAEVAGQKVANTSQMAPIALTSASGKEEGLDGRPAEEAYQRSARRVQHAGFRSRPLAKTEAVAIQVEGGARKLVVVAEDDGVSLSLDEGDAVLYSPKEPACRVKVDKDGVMSLVAASGKNLTIDVSGAGDIVLDGGTLKVTREHDGLNVGTLSASAGGTPVTFTYTPGGYPVPGTPVVGTSVALTGIVADGTGAAHVKG